MQHKTLILKQYRPAVYIFNSKCLQNKHYRINKFKIMCDRNISEFKWSAWPHRAC